MVRTLIPVALAILAGGSIVLQQALNANLRGALHSAAWSGVTSYVVGLLCMLILTATLRDPLPSYLVAARIPWWAWTGGAFGAFFIGLGIFLVPQMGAATFLALLVTGQMLASILFDHFGLIGLPIQPVSLTRLIGAAFLILGVILIRL